MLWINGTFDFTLMIVVINWASFSFLIFSFHFGGCRVWQVTICVGHCSTHIGFIAISLLYKTFQEYVLLLWNEFGRLVWFEGLFKGILKDMDVDLSHFFNLEQLTTDGLTVTGLADIWIQWHLDTKTFRYFWHLDTTQKYLNVKKMLSKCQSIQMSEIGYLNVKSI